MEETSKNNLALSKAQLDLLYKLYYFKNGVLLIGMDYSFFCEKPENDYRKDILNAKEYQKRTGLILVENNLVSPDGYGFKINHLGLEALRRHLGSYAMRRLDEEEIAAGREK